MGNAWNRLTLEIPYVKRIYFHSDIEKKVVLFFSTNGVKDLTLNITKGTNLLCLCSAYSCRRKFTFITDRYIPYAGMWTLETTRTSWHGAEEVEINIEWGIARATRHEEAVIYMTTDSSTLEFRAKLQVLKNVFKEVPGKVARSLPIPIRNIYRITRMDGRIERYTYVDPDRNNTDPDRPVVPYIRSEKKVFKACMCTVLKSAYWRRVERQTTQQRNWEGNPDPSLDPEYRLFRLRQEEEENDQRPAG